MTSDSQTESGGGVSSTAWLGGVPDVPKGKSKNVLVTLEWPNGKRTVRTARYANALWMEWHYDYTGEDIDEEGGKKWTGWMDDRLDSVGDELSMELEGKVVSWMPLPPPNEKADLPPTVARGPRSGTEGAIGG